MGSLLDIRKLRVVIAIAAVAIAAFAAGCGDDDSTDATEAVATTEVPTGELAKADLATEADSLCTASGDRIVAEADAPDFGDDGPQPEEVSASVPFFTTTADEQEVLFDQLSQLQPAKSVEKEWEEFLSLFEIGAVQYSDDLLAAAEDGDPEALYSTALDRQRDLSKLAIASGDLGMKVCGIPATP